jgi:hypothetical protein
MSEAEHGKFESATTAAAGHDAAPLAEPEGVNAGSPAASSDPDAAVASDSPRPHGRHRAQTPPTEPDPGSQTPSDGGDLLGAPTTGPVSGQDSGSID